MKKYSKLYTLITFLTLVIIAVIICCGGPDHKRKMKIAKHEKREMIKPINVDKEILKDEDIVTVITTTTYSREDFTKLEEKRKRWVDKKKKDDGKDKE
tara:strand:- start:113 stop:406 length:294 start_codon:yes stop_codon:yes gene_type:complete